MEQNRDHPIMRVLMLLRNKNGQGTKLEEGYISNPDWMCLALSLCPGMTAKEMDQLGMEWREVGLSPLVKSADRCHALNYEGTKTGGREPNKVKETPLYFYPSGKKGRSVTYSLTRLGEKRAEELKKVILQANVNYPRPIGRHSCIYVRGDKVKIAKAIKRSQIEDPDPIVRYVMSHFYESPWGMKTVDDDDSDSAKSRIGARLVRLTSGDEVEVLSQIDENVIFVRAKGHDGFLRMDGLDDPLDDLPEEQLVLTQ